MSACIILQGHDQIFVGSDSAKSIMVDGEFYREDNNLQKIFNINNELFYCSGRIDLVNVAIQYFKCHEAPVDIEKLELFLQTYFPYTEGDYSNLGIQICRIVDGESIVIGLDQKSGFKASINKVPQGYFMPMAGGLGVEKAPAIMERCLASGGSVEDIFTTTFNGIASQVIGGNMTVWQLDSTTKKIILNKQIVEENVKYHIVNKNDLQRYSIWAPTLCGDMVLSKKLKVSNANSSIDMDENGATFTNCDITINKGTSTLKLNPTDGIMLTNDGVNQFYIDGSGNANFSGKLNAASGTFTGAMTAGSININNRFIVDSNGNLTAKSGTFGGSLNAATGTFTGTLQGVDGSFSGTISASNISGGSISGTTITGGTITGATLNTNNGAFSVDSSGALHANTATFGSGSTTFSLDNNGFKILQDGIQKTNLYINGLITDVVAAKAISVIGGGSVLTTGDASSFAPSSHYHGTLYSNSSNSGRTVYISSNTNFVCPDNGDLGTSSNPWISVRANNVYNSGGLITSSDERKKNTIAPLNDKYKLLFDKLNPVSYKYNEGTSGRTHLGLIAQEVEQSINDVGLTDKECAILVKDPVYSEMNEDGSYDETSEVVDYDYSIRYNELIPMLINEIKELKNETKELKQKVNILEQ